jgi:hypothetical protein
MADKAPKTWEAISKHLPVIIKAYNARWTDRERTTKLDLPNKPPRENQVLNAGFGDVIYACEWSDRDVMGLRRSASSMERTPFATGAENRG